MNLTRRGNGHSIHGAARTRKRRRLGTGRAHGPDDKRWRFLKKKRNLLRRWKFLNGGSTILLEELYYIEVMEMLSVKPWGETWTC